MTRAFSQRPDQHGRTPSGMAAWHFARQFASHYKAKVAADRAAAIAAARWVLPRRGAWTGYSGWWPGGVHHDGGRWVQAIPGADELDAVLRRHGGHRRRE